MLFSAEVEGQWRFFDDIIMLKFYIPVDARFCKISTTMETQATTSASIHLLGLIRDRLAFLPPSVSPPSQRSSFSALLRRVPN